MAVRSRDLPSPLMDIFLSKRQKKTKKNKKKKKIFFFFFFFFVKNAGWCEGVMYLMSPGRPADTGLQLGKACYPCSR